MKLAVFSDAHRNIKPMQAAVEELDNIDYLIYAGDGLDKVINSKISEEFEILAVRGNCDYGVGYPLEKVIKIAGVRIFLTHGNRYRIKRGFDQLYYRAQEVEADIVIFGHTHCRYVQEIDDLLLFNPGSISKPRDNNGFSYGLLEITDSDINYQHCGLSNYQK